MTKNKEDDIYEQFQENEPSRVHCTVQLYMLICARHKT